MKRMLNMMMVFTWMMTLESDQFGCARFLTRGRKSICVSVIGKLCGSFHLCPYLRDDVECQNANHSSLLISFYFILQFAIPLHVSPTQMQVDCYVPCAHLRDLLVGPNTCKNILPIFQMNLLWLMQTKFSVQSSLYFQFIRQVFHFLSCNGRLVGQDEIH